MALTMATRSEEAGDLTASQSELAGFYEATRRIASAPDPWNLLETLLDSVVRLCKADIGRVWLLDSGGTVLALAISWGPGGRYRPQRARHRPDEYLAGIVAHTGQVINIPDVEQDPRWVHSPDTEGLTIRSALVAPLHGNRRLVGVVTALGPLPAQFTGASEQLLVALADQTAFAIERFGELRARRQRGQALRQSEEQFRSDRRRLEEQLRQAQKMEAVGRLAGTVAHDFNNLLTIINGYSEILLLRQPPAETWRSYVAEIAKAGDRAALLTHRLLAYSRQQMLAPRVLDINAVVAETEKMLRRLIGEDVELVVKLEPDLGRVKADPSQLEQVIMNLAVNARDAMPRGGKLTIRTENVVVDGEYARRHPETQAGSYVMLAVSDTGIGMDEETLARIFEPFFTTKEPSKGTGLGLSMVYGFVKQSGGSIEVESAPGRGATFKIYLPGVQGAVEAPAAADAQAAPARGLATVLLIEDEETVRSLACTALQAAGYTVLEAGRGDLALELARRHAGLIHLLIADVVMPELSGHEVAERLTPLYPGMKVLYMSGYLDEEVLRHGVIETSVAFLQKPFTPSTLVQKVRQVLDAP